MFYLGIRRTEYLVCIFRLPHPRRDIGQQIRGNRHLLHFGQEYSTEELLLSLREPIGKLKDTLRSDPLPLALLADPSTFIIRQMKRGNANKRA